MTPDKPRSNPANKPANNPASKAAPRLRPVDQRLCFLIYSTSLAMTQTYKPLLEETGLTYPQYLAMVVLWEQDGIAVKDLAARLGQDSGSMTPLLKRLESAGLVTRQRTPGDERSLSLRLTPAGQAMREKARKVDAAFERACDLTDAQVGELLEGMEILRSHLQR
ncbi:MarR family transcriptional regulator [Cupriavidus pauculus]|uniref:MarR family transcriptional regulator n=1 Tax=Cupriavidus pauculus TaxID=82633 RepID=A0A5P2HB78_9BURK|nr:MarR family transcriptional regulator [Cupriavidus pauculus]QET04854.1 MarR family transcriptional regulator [Cupriavidus pauculus]